jgi:hypothetical protein
MYVDVFSLFLFLGVGRGEELGKGRGEMRVAWMGGNTIELLTPPKNQTRKTAANDNDNNNNHNRGSRAMLEGATNYQSKQ